MKYLIVSFMIISSLNIQGQSRINFMLVSQELLEAIRDDHPTHQYVETLADASRAEISAQIQTNDQRLAFWVNIYNGYIQHILKNDPDLYQDRRAFFSEPKVKIAGEFLSFEQIEHGIIRKSQWPLGLGYIRKWFPAKWEKDLRVKDRDWRVHFALNCGAKDCPPIAIYDAKNLDYQFDFMTKELLTEITDYDLQTNSAKSIALFSWFRGDFGGKKGVKQILKRYGITPSVPENVSYKDYDWTLSLGNFRTIPAR